MLRQDQPQGKVVMANPVSLTLNPVSMISGALRAASASTGAEFDYLYKVAKRESALDPAAKAATSSAAGLFQFIEQTWLEVVKTYGPAHGLADEADSIVLSADGKYRVADSETRRAILDKRFDATIASRLAGELAQENRRALEGSLGRRVDAAELYAAHFLGASGAKTLLAAGPDVEAAALLPKAAAANIPVFYDGGRARTVGELMEAFRVSMGEIRAAPTPTPLERAAQSATTLASAPLEPPFHHRDATGADVRETAGGVATLAVSNEMNRRDPSSPSLRSGPASAVAMTLSSRGLSPLAIIVLQALDPTAIARERSSTGADRARQALRD